MRVLAIGNLYPPAATGGYERIWVGAMRALQTAGHDVEVLTTIPVSGRPVTGPDPEGPPVHRELDWWWRDFGWPKRSLRERAAMVKANAAVLDRHLAGVDVISWWGMGGMTLTLLEQARRAGVPGVGYVADAWMAYGFDMDQWLATWRHAGPVRALAERRAGAPVSVDPGPAARWLFISRCVEEIARDDGGWDLPDTGILTAGVDLERFKERAERPWAWRLTCIGRVERRKGVATAIEALAQLPEATLAIVGEAEPEHRVELDALAQRLGVTERIEWLETSFGAVVDAYADADVLLFPVTWKEPWGLVPLEAMSVGRPVVATGTGGSGEYLQDGHNALLFPPNDAAALADRVRALAADPELRARLRAGGLETAARHSEQDFERRYVDEVERAANGTA